MLDINFIRENQEKVKYAIESRKIDPKKADLERLLELDKKRVEIIKQVDQLKSERNKISEHLTGKPDEKTLVELSKLKVEIENLEPELRKVQQEWQRIMDWLPNVPLEDVPFGKSEDDNIEIIAWSNEKGQFSKDQLSALDGSKKFMPQKPTFADKDFEPKPHWEIGKSLNIIDTEAGAKVSGSRFYYLKNEGVMIMDAIFTLLKKKLYDEGFSPMIVPLLVNEDILYGSGHFPGDADQIYSVSTENVEDKAQLYLIGSSEPSLFGSYKDTIIESSKLPIKMLSLSTCLRSEAGSWGKDVRGIKRTHQFDKLEMDMIIENDLEKAKETHKYLLSLNEWLLQQLRIPYHVINMCTADLGYFPAAQKYDIEVWIPSEQKYMETMSNSITTDYQARRLNIRYKDTDGKMRFAYTLNDTGATHRLLIAIIEHYQQSDGSVLIPDVLKDLVGKDKISPK